MTLWQCVYEYKYATSERCAHFCIVYQGDHIGVQSLLACFPRVEVALVGFQVQRPTACFNPESQGIIMWSFITVFAVLLSFMVSL